MLAAFVLGFTAHAVWATDSDAGQLPVDSIAIGDLDGDGLQEMLVYITTQAYPELYLNLSQSGVSTRIVTLAEHENVVWEMCKIVDELGWNGSRGILISTEEETPGHGWLTKCRVLDSSSFQLIGQAIGVEEPDRSVWLVQWRGDSIPDGSINILDLADSMSSAPMLLDNENIQHRALVGAVDLDNNGVLDGIDLTNLVLCIADCDESSAQTAAIADWKAGLWSNLVAFFTCAPCNRNCGSLIRELNNLINECNEDLEPCMPCLNDPNECQSTGELVECWSKYKDCDRRSAELAGRAAGQCFCIFQCGLKMLKPLGVPL